MIEIKLHAGDTVDTAVEKLLEAKKQGIKAYCNFNGKMLYSDTVTLDSAYLDICGRTKEEMDKIQKQFIEDSKRLMELEKEKAKMLIDDKLERGQKLIYPFRYEAWKQLVLDDAEGMYTGYITEQALEIMEAIEAGKNKDELVEMFEEQGHSGHSASLVMSIVTVYSKNGTKFLKAVHRGKWTPEDFEFMNKVAEDNKNYLDSLNKEEKKKSKKKKLD